MSISQKLERIDVTKIRITQVRSAIGQKYDQEKTLIGLGLNKMHKSVVCENNNSIRGMVQKVRHLVEVKNVNY